MEYDVWQIESALSDVSDDQNVAIASADNAEDNSGRLIKEEVRQRSAIETEVRAPKPTKFNFAKLRNAIDNLLPSRKQYSSTASKLSSDEYLRNLVSDANNEYTVLPDPESHQEICHTPANLLLRDYCDPDNLNDNELAKSHVEQLVKALNSLNSIGVNTKCASKTTYKVGFGFVGPKTSDSSALVKQTFKSWRLGHAEELLDEQAPDDHRGLEECDTSILVLIHLGTDGAIRVRREVGGFVSHTSFNSTIDKTLQIAETQSSHYPPQTKPLQVGVAVAELLRLQLTQEVRLPRQPTQAYTLALIFTVVVILFTGALFQTYKVMVSKTTLDNSKKKKKKPKVKQDVTEKLVGDTVELPSPD